MPYLLIRLQQIQQQNICLIGIHAPPQVPIDASGMKPYIQELIPFMDNGKVKKDWNICKAGDSILLMGDLNAVPHSWAYEQILKSGIDRPSISIGIVWTYLAKWWWFYQISIVSVGSYIYGSSTA